MAIAVLLWVFLSEQRRVPRTLRTAVGVLLRTLPLFLVLLLICHGLNVSVLLAAAVLGIALWVLLIPGSDLSLGAFGILYVIQQWILGWPDRVDTLLEPPPPCEAPASQLGELIGKAGVASSALRPTGTVTVAGTEHAARSVLGYVDPRQLVRVVGIDGATLIVRAADVASGAL